MRTFLLWSLLLCSVGTAHLLAGSAPLSWMSGPKPPLLRECSALDGPVARLRGGCASGFSSYIEDAKTWNPILLALIGTSFGWLMTALGSAVVAVHGLGLSDLSYRKVRSTAHRPAARTPPPPPCGHGTVSLVPPLALRCSMPCSASQLV